MYKVLVIAYYYPPMGLSGVQRTLKFTKYFKQYGWEPVVLTAADTAYYAHDYSLLKEAEEAGIRVVRTEGKDVNSLLKKHKTVKMPRESVRKALSRISSFFFVPDNKKGWATHAYPAAKELLKNENFDIIFVSAPPFSSINLAYKLKEEFEIPLVIDYRDLWFSNQYAFYPTPFHKVMHKKMEYRALKKADKVIAINRKMKEKIINDYQFLTLDDIYIIPQGFDTADFEGLLPEHRESKKMRITYSGIFYEYITPKYFLKAFKKLSVERPDVASNIELEFIGYLRENNRKLAKKLEIRSYITEHGYINHKEALAKLMATDILWAMVGKSKNSNIISLGKLYEYFGTRKPIILCAPEGAAQIAADGYKAAYVVQPDDIDGIKNLILKVYQQYIAKQLPAPDEDFINKHRRDYLTEQLTNQFQLLLKERIQ